MAKLATAVNNINNSARLMEENALLKHQLRLLQEKKNEYRNELQTVLDQMSPDPPAQTVKVDDNMKVSVRGQLEEHSRPKRIAVSLCSVHGYLFRTMVPLSQSRVYRQTLIKTIESYSRVFYMHLTGPRERSSGGSRCP